MARTRYLKPSFFMNDQLAECEPMARLLFAGLWTLADRDGRMEYRPKRIKVALFPYDNCDLDSLVSQLAARGFVQVYEVDGERFLCIPTFGDHQKCHPHEPSLKLPAPPTIVAHGGNAESLHVTACHDIGMTGRDILHSDSNSNSDSNSDFVPKNTHTPREASDDFSRPGWAAVAFDEFVAVWNATQRAAPWKHLTAPAGWVDAAASPGWLDRAKAAMAHLPKCRFFETPLALTKFLEVGWADRILAGEFDNAKRPAGRAGAEAPRPPASVSSRRWRDDALENMTDDQYAAWCKARRPSQAAVGLSQAIKRP